MLRCCQAQPRELCAWRAVGGGRALPVRQPARRAGVAARDGHARATGAPDVLLRRSRCEKTSYVPAPAARRLPAAQQASCHSRARPPRTDSFSTSGLRSPLAVNDFIFGKSFLLKLATLKAQITKSQIGTTRNPGTIQYPVSDYHDVAWLLVPAAGLSTPPHVDRAPGCGLSTPRLLKDLVSLPTPALPAASKALLEGLTAHASLAVRVQERH